MDYLCCNCLLCFQVPEDCFISVGQCVTDSFIIVFYFPLVLPFIFTSRYANNQLMTSLPVLCCLLQLLLCPPDNVNLSPSFSSHVLFDLRLFLSPWWFQRKDFLLLAGFSQCVFSCHRIELFHIQTQNSISVKHYSKD